VTSTCTASGWTRSSLIGLALLGAALTGCATAQGAPVPECGPDWEPVIVNGPDTITGPARTIAAECYRVTAENRIEVGVLMPPGPECYAVDLVEVIESDEAVSLEVRIGESRSPVAGACPDEELAWSVTVEFNGPIEGRRVLDASAPAGLDG
jgi:hypothetical protein